MNACKHLRLVEPKPSRHGDYRDFLNGPNRRSRHWRIERTDKAPGDLEMHAKGVERHG